VLAATPKGPRRGAQPPTWRRPHTDQTATTSAGDQARPSPQNGPPHRETSDPERVSDLRLILAARSVHRRDPAAMTSVDSLCPTPWRLLPTASLAAAARSSAGDGCGTGNAPGYGSGCTRCCWTSSAATVVSTGRGPAWTRSACAPNGGLPDRAESDRPRQARLQIPSAGRAPRQPVGGRVVGGQHPRLDVAGANGGRGAGDQGPTGAGPSPANGSAGTGMWWSGRWRGWSATGGCRSATSDAPTSCWRSST
jgi:hypothetical protein